MSAGLRRPLVLASASPRRRQLLAQIVAQFEVLVADVAEWEPTHGDGRAQVLHNAQAKAVAAGALRAEALIIAADTTVALDGRLYAKPRDLAQARQYLAELSGRTHSVYTGVVVWTAQRSEAFCEEARVRFRQLSADDIAAYCRDVQVLDKAGAYAIQDEGARIVEGWEGAYDTIMGLPTQRLAAVLARFAD